MSKRRPGGQLTQDNWDDDEEPQEAGTFTVASADALKGRQIKKAKRRGITSNSEEGSSAFKAFGGFGGFGAATGTEKPTFSFNVSTTKEPVASHTNGTKSEPSEPAKTEPTKSASSDSSTDRSQYLSQLKSLNESVTKWIQTHVGKNPYCILTPIFKDYETHLAKIEKLDPEHKESEKKDPEVDKDKTEKQEDKKTTETKITPKSNEKETADVKQTTFSFGATSDSSVKAATGFTFGPASSAGTGSGIFGAKPPGGASTSGFTFATTKPSTGGAEGTGSKEEDEEYVPPKDEVKAVVEKDAFYTKRCKLFYKKGESWQEKGLGNLHLKPCDGKTQLLIRADTNLGNILLNILVSGSVPASRQGKNNVMLVCVPNPPLDEKKGDDKAAVSMLVRVKTSADADELFEKIQEAKSAQ